MPLIYAEWGEAVGLWARGADAEHDRLSLSCTITDGRELVWNGGSEQTTWNQRDEHLVWRTEVIDSTTGEPTYMAVGYKNNDNVVFNSDVDLVLVGDIRVNNMTVADVISLKTDGSLIVTGTLNVGSNVSCSFSGDTSLSFTEAQLKSFAAMEAGEGATLTFAGSGSDTLEYGNNVQYSKRLTVDGGVVDFGNTRQTMAKWEITLKNGASLRGDGGSYNYGSGNSKTAKAAMDFNQDVVIKAESGDNTSSATTRLRGGNGRTLTYNVSEGATLNVTGRIFGDNDDTSAGNITKSGVCKATISSCIMLNNLPWGAP